MNDITTTKITKLTGPQVSALKAAAKELDVIITKTTAEFKGGHREAAQRIRNHQETLAAKFGRKGGDYQALHAVARKLENWELPGNPGHSTVPSDERRAEVLAEETAKDAAKKAEAPTAVEVDGVKVAETRHLSLVADSTDPESLVNIPGLGKSVPAKGVFGPSVQEAVAEETAKRTAQKAADELLAANGYTKDEEAPAKPTWGTAKSHGIKPGMKFINFGTNPKQPTNKGREVTYEDKGGFTNMGGYATRFWAVVPAGQPEGEKAAPAKGKAPAKAESTKAAPAKQEAKKAAPPKVPAKVVDGKSFGTSGPACHGLKVGDKFTYYGDDRKAPAKKGVKLTLQITDRIWIEGVDSKGKVGMRVHIAKSFWATKP